MKRYHIFISHAWDYSEHYQRILQWLAERPWFVYSDYSVPITKPLDVRGTMDLRAQLEERIAKCSCIIIPSGMYVNHSNWIDYEIKTAITYKKPIIAIRPWGQQRIPLKISNNASVIVGWNEASVIDAIRKYSL